MSFNGDLYPSDDGLQLDTKGQIHSYSTENIALPISGNNDYVLVEDSSTATGLAWKVNAHSAVTASSTTTFTNKSIAFSGNTITATLAELDTALGTTGTASSSTFLRGDNSWATAGGGKLELIENYTEASATGSTKTFTVTEDPDDFSCLVLEFSIGCSASLDLLLQINGSVGSGEYGWEGTLIAGGSETLISATGTASEICPSEILSSDGQTGCGRVSIYLPEAGTTRKSLNVTSTGQNTSAYFRTSACNFVASATITSITVLTSTSTWKQDSNFTLYRMAK